MQEEALIKMTKKVIYVNRNNLRSQAIQAKASQVIPNKKHIVDRFIDVTYKLLTTPGKPKPPKPPKQERDSGWSWGIGFWW
jgi:hypothetical protein